MAKILIIDDDADHTKMVCVFLARDNHFLETAATGEQAMNLLSAANYDLIVLDWELPDITGVEILKWYRRKGSAPVIMLTGKGKIDDREAGLDSGADDYLIKPFSGKELAARVRALLRRPTTFVGTTLTAGQYTLNPAALTVSKCEEQIRLQPQEFALLEFLARHPEEVFQAETLVARVWRENSEATGDSVRTAIKQIRKKLGETIVETVVGAGYKLGS
jgi:two-component system OmpR family response regulator